MLKLLKKIPWWGYLEGLFFFVLQYGLYRLADFLAEMIGTKGNAFCPKIPAIDNLIPVVPVFIVIYIFSYIFWICGPIAVSLTSRENSKKFFIGMMAAYLIGFLLFVFAPTYMSRSAENLFEIAERPGIFNQLLGSIYSADGGDMAFNLCPSYHCLISWCCYLGVRGQKEIPKWFRTYSLIMAILICMSTVFTKQHYVMDVFCGSAIAWICFAVVGKIYRKN